MIGFDNGSQVERVLDGHDVAKINPDLTSKINLTTAQPLKENTGIAFRGNQKGGPFDIPGDLARQMLRAPVNPNGRPNSDVIKPWANGMDITQGWRDMWLIDFGIGMSEDEACLYEQPYIYIKAHVAPKYAHKKPTWWLHERTRPEMRNAISTLQRFIVTPHTSKYRLFIWLSNPIIPDHAVIVYCALR